jgi:hypothetical protein
VSSLHLKANVRPCEQIKVDREKNMVNLVSFYLDDEKEVIDNVSLIGECMYIKRESIVQSVEDNTIRCRRHLCPYKEEKKRHQEKSDEAVDGMSNEE